ncbi:hypothetical protein J6590_002337 [Homalodisca vitripennis]|nr:hypothetical protein J6590_002337 [Homalodisca vitripennis]
MCPQVSVLCLASPCSSRRSVASGFCVADAVRSLLECVKCHKTYSSPHTLRRHVRLECGQEPRFRCPYCPHRTKQRYNLMLHISRTHREVLSQAAVSLDK